MTKWRMTRGQFIRRATIFASVPALAIGGLALQSDAVSGNIGTASIQIDGGTNGADLYPGIATNNLNSGTVDWVKDSTDPGTSTDCVPPAGSSAGCYVAGTTSYGTAGDWNGTRIIDSFGGGETDQFVKGGKENDEGTWNIGGGSIGSSKYDITQAYLANNANDLYFGMERRGNNGTTAFDFEFNQEPGQSTLPTGATNSTGLPNADYFPTRNPGDLLFTYEMSGSGSSGSATPHIFSWICADSSTTVTTSGCAGSYVEESLPSGVLTSINNTPTPGAPWGFVNSKGAWAAGATGTLPTSDSFCSSNAGKCLSNFEFAEADAPLSVFPNFQACSTNPYYVQIRTRSSATSTSDLKDTTGIFAYNFSANATPTVAKTSADGGALSVTLTGHSDAGATRTWQEWNSGTSSWDPVTNGAGHTITDAGGTTTTSTLTYSNWASDTDVTSTRTSFGASDPAPEQDVPTQSPPGTATTFVLGSTYYYVVTATYADSSESPASNERSIKIALAGNQVTLGWEPLANATGYNIYRGTTSGHETFLASVSGNATVTYTDTNDTSNATSATPPAKTASNSYLGSLYSATFRMVATESSCPSDSAPFTVTKVIAVDP